MALRKQYAYISTLIKKRDVRLQSVRAYTDDHYGPINQALLEGSTMKRFHRNIVDDIDSLFEMVPPIEKDIVVYRGVTKRHSFGILNGYISTSYDYDTAMDFTDRYTDNDHCCIFVITIPSGSKVLPIEDVSANRSEGEILLPRSGFFEVKDSYNKYGMETYALLYHSSPPLVEEVKSSSTEKQAESSITENQIIDLLTDISDDEVELLGVEESIRGLATDLENRYGLTISSSTITKAIDKRSKLI